MPLEDVDDTDEDPNYHFDHDSESSEEFSSDNDDDLVVTAHDVDKSLPLIKKRKVACKELDGDEDLIEAGNDLIHKSYPVTKNKKLDSKNDFIFYM